MWTLFIRVIRIKNLLADNELSAAGRTWWWAVTVIIIALALVALVGEARWVPIARRTVTTVAEVLAVVTILVWAEQVLSIVIEWKSVGFVVVHLVLAAISCTLAGLVLAPRVRERLSARTQNGATQ